MPLPGREEIVTQQHKRYFYQPNGPAPENEIRYAGQDGQFMVIESAAIPHGDISPINVGDPSSFKKYKQVGASVDAPDFATFTVNFLEYHGAIPRHLYDMIDCMTSFFEVTGFCKDPSVITRKISDYVKIYSNGEATNSSPSGGAFDSDDMVQDDLDFTALGSIYLVAGMSVGEEGAAEVASEVIDNTYGSQVQCRACGPNRNGTELIYWVQDNTVASPGIGPAVGYTTDGYSTITIVAINGADSNDTPKAIAVVGQYLVVVTNGPSGSEGYFYAEIDEITGAPGTWTQVTTGFVAGNGPNDIYVASAREVWFCGDNGYIYKSTNILSGVGVIDPGDTISDNLNRIDGDFANVVVAVGDGAAITFSTNSGRTFSVATNAPAAFSLDALQVLDEFRWWVGDSEGDVYWTNSRAESVWTEQILPAVSAGALATIQDIVFATEEIGYIVAATAAPAGVFFSTINGGADWEEGSVNTFPTLDRINRIAYPAVENKAVAANNLVLGGLAGNGTDGIVLAGAVPVKG